MGDIVEPIPKRIIHLLYSGLGGHSSVFFSLREADRSNSYDHIPVFGGIESLNPDSLNRCIKEDIPYCFFKKKQGIDVRFYTKILKSMIRQKPDMIFLHGAGFILPVIFYWLRYPQVKIIIRDTQAAHLKTFSEWVFLGIAHLICHKTIFLTEESKKSLQEKFPIIYSPSKTAVISNGINIDKFSNSLIKKKNDSINIGMQSRLQAIKDHPSLIKAFNKIIKLYPQYQLQLHIAGDGQTMDDLKKMVFELDLSENVFFWGMLNEKKLTDFLQHLDIYVHATFGETMSNSILQAMSCGLPVIASNVWGVNNMINDGYTGVLYESENVDQLSDKIKFMIENPIIAKRIGDAARVEIENKYSSKIMSQNYEKIFREISSK
ncbi:MAG: hypothetical protein JWQ79_3619 [Mucilaginibacter sp.]|nr:hypothetical protein [Mucilaginibacter sp.]